MDPSMTLIDLLDDEVLPGFPALASSSHDQKGDVKPHRENADDLPGSAPTRDMMTAVNDLWARSNAVVPAFINAAFEMEHNGAPFKPFMGLPPWAVPIPKDFNKHKHLGWDTHAYILTKRLHVVIVTGSAPRSGWLKPVLDDTMKKWLDDENKRFHAVKKLWEAFDFLCFWVLESARMGETRPILRSLDTYIEGSVYDLRVSTREKMRLYQGQADGTAQSKGKGLASSRHNTMGRDPLQDNPVENIIGDVANSPQGPYTEDLGSPEDTIAWIAKAAAVDPALNNFASWATFFEAQLVEHDNVTQQSSPWSSIEVPFRIFTTALLEKFPTKGDGKAPRPELREWAIAVSKTLEERKAHRERCDRVDAMIAKAHSDLIKQLSW